MFSRIAFLLIASMVGGLAWVLPSHLLGQIVEHYPPTGSTWIGDGLWNANPLVSVPFVVLIGFSYGLLRPQDWYLSWPATWSIMPLSLLIDYSRNPTSHNLLPIELIGFAIVNAPVLAAARAGKWMHTKRRREPFKRG